MAIDQISHQIKWTPISCHEGKASQTKPDQFVVPEPSTKIQYWKTFLFYENL